MKKIKLLLFITFHFFGLSAQESFVDQNELKEDFHEILNDLSQSYIYLDEKNVDLGCIHEKYEEQIASIKTNVEKVLFFEYLLDEFYDSHVILNTNTNASFRLYSPVHASIFNKKIIISNVWSSQLEEIEYNLVGAELLLFNGEDIHQLVERFPTQCNDKSSRIVKEWIINKILAGRYNEPRILGLKLFDGRSIEFDLDGLNKRKDEGLLSSQMEGDIGIIRINNSLGTNDLIQEFDQSLDALMNTQGLIIDLRNTVDGGNTYVARGIMGRFIAEDKPYQKHWTLEQYDGKTKVERSWTEYVSPRLDQYKNPVVVLVGRWTGSMGEGLAIGFEGIQRGIIMGSEMEGLAGEINGFTIGNQTFGFQLSTAKLFHVNDTAREQYLPTYYEIQTTNKQDELLEAALLHLKN